MYLLLGDTATILTAPDIKQNASSSFIPPAPNIFDFHIFYLHITHQLLNVLKTKRDINQRYMKKVDLHFVRSE